MIPGLSDSTAFYVFLYIHKGQTTVLVALLISTSGLAHPDPHRASSDTLNSSTCHNRIVLFVRCLTLSPLTRHALVRGSSKYNCLRAHQIYFLHRMLHHCDAYRIRPMSGLMAMSPTWRRRLFIVTVLLVSLVLTTSVFLWTL
ncbi:hypothetical protein C8Q73DRAFT_96920 [Cubamyces lactineus]|nr:hypothetical protein C8Q73DRAFT_96920 [Cubamyces lactineus]